ncbi:MAG: BatD family protein [Desulfuromonas sp.]|nr:BatD family protein [Desulfuromonas sp.]
MVKGRMKAGFVWVLTLATLLLPFHVCAQLQVKPARNSIGADESLRVEIKLLDGDADALDLTPLEHDFDIVSRARGSQVNIINGAMSKINTWSLLLLPKHSGTLTLPRLCAGSSCSEPVVITVSDTPATGDDAKLILEHGSLPERVFVGQQVLYKVRLLTRVALQQATLSHPMPEGVECEVIKLGEDVRSETYRDGWHYDVIELAYALVPQRSGTLLIPPVTLEAEVGESRTRGFDPFGGRGQLVRRRSASAEITVEPPVRTEHPWIPAQTLKVEDSWAQNPPQLRVGEPATRTITVQASGTTAARLEEIEFTPPPEFRVYPDQAERENIPDVNSGLVAQLRQSIAIVPREAGVFTLPAISFTWWDMRAQRWSTTEIEAQEVSVLPVERIVQIPAQGATPRADRDGVGVGPDAVDEPKQAAVPQTQTKQTETKPVVDTLRWQLATAICAGGWIVSLLLWWRYASKRRRVSRQKTTGEDCPQRNLARLEHTLLQAAQRREPKEARHQLQQWAACLYPASATPLDTLAQQGSDAMTTALAELNAALYAEADSSWDGAALALAVRNHVRESKDSARDTNGRKDPELPPLYPQAGA